MTQDIWISKEIVVGDDQSYRYRIRSGEGPGVVDVVYDEDLPSGEKRTEVVTFDAKLGPEIAKAIMEIAEFENKQ